MRTNRTEPRYFICSLSTHAARKLVAYYNRELEPLGITAQQMMALGVLWECDGVSLGEFARRAEIGKAAAVTMIQRLKSMNLVDTEIHPEDARLNVILLTDKARELAPVILDKVEKLEQKLEYEIGGSNLKTLTRALSIICDLEL